MIFVIPIVSNAKNTVKAIRIIDQQISALFFIIASIPNMTVAIAKGKTATVAEKAAQNRHAIANTAVKLNTL